MTPVEALLARMKGQAGGSRRLRALKVHEISIVANPAVQGARISLAKSADPATVTKGEVAAAVELAKAGTPAPRSFWKAHIAALGRELAPDAPPAGQMNAACQHPDGQALFKALVSIGT